MTRRPARAFICRRQRKKRMEKISKSHEDYLEAIVMLGGASSPVRAEIGRAHV